MFRKITLFACLITVSLIQIKAQIQGLSISAWHSKTEVGQTSIFGPSSTEYKRIHPEFLLVFEFVEHEGRYVYMHLNPFLMPFTMLGEGKPPLVFKPSLPTNPMLMAVDYTCMQLDMEWPVMFKQSDFNIDLGFAFLWKVEGMNDESRLYQGIVRSNLQRQSDYAYGSGRFASKSRVGIGPLIAAKYVNSNDKFALRAAAGSGWYGTKGGTYNWTELGGYYALNDVVTISIKSKKYFKKFTHQNDDFIEEFQTILTERLGDELHVNTSEFSVGVILNVSVEWLSFITGAHEY